jgi:hypothetical protein
LYELFAALLAAVLILLLLGRVLPLMGLQQPQRFEPPLAHRARKGTFNNVHGGNVRLRKKLRL